jgi:hypothetical protein
MANFGLSVEQRETPSLERARSLTSIIAQSFRVALPAVVQSFDPGPPATVSVLIATNELVKYSEGAAAISLKTEAMQLPLLQDVPVVMPGAGGWSMTFPIQPGDECLVVFADTPLDVWFQNGGVNNNPISQRRHSLSDAVAIFGLRSKPRGLAGYSTSSAQLRNDDGTVVIDLTDDQVTVTAPAVAVECSGEVSVQARTVSVEAETATVQASAVTLGSATTIDGKAFLTHTHSGVLTGGSTTGPVA